MGLRHSLLSCSMISVCSSKRYSDASFLAPLISRLLSVSSHVSYLFFSSLFNIDYIIFMAFCFVNTLSFKFSSLYFNAKNAPRFPLIPLLARWLNKISGLQQVHISVTSICSSSTPASRNTQ